MNPGQHEPWRGRIVFAVFLAISAFLLFGEHRVHALGVLPYLVLLACPLLHLLQHGHGQHRTSRKPPHEEDRP